MSTACFSGAIVKPRVGIQRFIVIYRFQRESEVKWVTCGSVVSSVRLPGPVLLLDARVVFLLCCLFGRSSEIQMESSAPVSKHTGSETHSAGLEKSDLLHNTYLAVCCGHRDTNLTYLGCVFPWTTSWSSSTATMSECGTSNMGSRSSFSYIQRRHV